MIELTVSQLFLGSGSYKTYKNTLMWLSVFIFQKGREVIDMIRAL